MNKKAFTLIEVLISLVLFSIIVLFLYKSLNVTQKSNDFYAQQLTKTKDKNQLKKMFFLDLINSDKKKISIENDRDKNSIIKVNSSNTYHNPFYTNITYMLSREKNLLRIESKGKFNKTKLNDEFFKSAYIDTIDTNVTMFRVDSSKKFAIYMTHENKEKFLFSF